MVFLIGLVLLIGSFFGFRYIYHNNNPTAFGTAFFMNILKFATSVAFLIGFLMVASIFIV